VQEFSTAIVQVFSLSRSAIATYRWPSSLCSIIILDRYVLQRYTYGNMANSLPTVRKNLQDA